MCNFVLSSMLRSFPLAFLLSLVAHPVGAAIERVSGEVERSPSLSSPCLSLSPDACLPAFLAQSPSEPVEITQIQINQTPSGLELQLETTG
ncbi:MAG: hypothetical protein MUF49_25890, partial [Oculatellaceae cyanobacterium Prado106]|nr:hypothetical protein [Oculatellaceae cyanobacterium Prado106]